MILRGLTRGTALDGFGFGTEEDGCWGHCELCRDGLFREKLLFLKILWMI